MQLTLRDRVAYAYTGGRAFDPARAVVVFIHGAAHDHSVWALQTRFLAHHGYSVLAVDLPGHGRSAGPALVSIDEQAAWLVELIEQAGARSVHLVGHSMGSLIALQAGAVLQQCLASVTLVGTAFPMRVSDALLDAARSDEQRGFAMINQWSHSSLVHHPGTPGPGFSVYMQNLRLMQRQPSGVLFTDLSACHAYADGAERIRALRCPVFFIVGANDLMTPPRAAQSLIDAAAARSGQVAPSVARIDRCGHALMSERPDAVLAALRGFLAAASGSK